MITKRFVTVLAAILSIWTIGLIAPVTATEWSHPEIVNQTAPSDDGHDYDPRIAEGPDGTLHAVWGSDSTTGGTGYDRDVWYARYDGSSWSDPEPVNTTAGTDFGNDTEPSMAVDASGTVHAVWVCKEDIAGAGVDSDIFYAANSGTGWSFPALVHPSGLSDTEVDLYPCLIPGTAGTIHLIWTSHADIGGAGNGDYDLFYSSHDGSSWSTPELVNSFGTTDSELDLSGHLMMDSSGDLHAVWESKSTHAGSGIDRDIFHSIRSGGSWSGPILLNQSGLSDSESDYAPRIFEAPDGAIHAVWESESDIGGSGFDTDVFHAIYQAAVWSAPDLVNSYGTLDSLDDSDPAMVITPAGTIHVLWQSTQDVAGAGTDADLLTTTDHGSGWAEPVVLHPNGTSDSRMDEDPWLILASTGSLYTIWSTSNDIGGIVGTDPDIVISSLAPSGPTPTPTAPGPTPTPTPTAVWYDLVMPDELLEPGETFLLLEVLGNPLTYDLPVDAYIILDYFGQYWFWPDWTQNMDYWRGNLPSGRAWTNTILEFEWPTGTGSAQGIKFWGALLDQGTMDLIVYDMVEWGFAE